MSKAIASARDSAKVGLHVRPRIIEAPELIAKYSVKHYNRLTGEVYSHEEFENLIVNAGLTYLVGSALLSTTAITTWYLGLTAASPTIAAADTMGSHAGWTEFTTYSEAVRQTATLVAGAAGAAGNSASPATFSINGSGTIGGVFLTSNNTKSGTTGTLFSAKALPGGNRAVVDTDAVDVTWSIAVTSS